MSWSTSTFCGFLGWLVILQSLWINPFLEVVEEERVSTCLLTQEPHRGLRFAVRAEDGFIYDALALRTWLRLCQSNGRAPWVIPTKPIGVVKPVRLAFRKPVLPRTPPVASPPPSPVRFRSIGTQTLHRVVRPTARIPSTRSAFRRVEKQGSVPP